MTFFIAIIGMLIAVVGATILNKKWPQIPLAVFQIGIGVAISLLPLPITLEFQPELFMVCIIAPLLFTESQRISRSSLRKNLRPILFLAFGLVFATVFFGGFFIHWLMPTMPLPLAFALAAIISPTDTVALKSLTKGLPLPGSLGAILEGESLFNDASGVVAFNVALATMLTGTFSLGQATLDFLFVAIGGLLLGLILGMIIIRIRLWLRARGYEEVTMLVVIQIITPFLIYMVAELVGVSGILAVVAAGLMHGIERDRLQKTTTRLRIISDNTWSVISYALNGLVFVLLGFMLPSVYQNLQQSQESSITLLAVLSVLIALGLVVIRFLWVSLPFANRTRPLDQFVQNKIGGGQSSGYRVSRIKYAAIAAVSGVHGTITLATALSIPFTLLDGSLFPMRNSILFIAAGVILVSLALAIVLLPLLIKKPVVDKGQFYSSEKAQRIILEGAFKQLNLSATPENHHAIGAVLGSLDEQLVDLESGVFATTDEPKMMALLTDAYEVELETVAQLQRGGKISSKVQSIYGHYASKSLQFMQTSFLQRLKVRVQLWFFRRRFNKSWNPMTEGQMEATLGKNKQIIDEFRLAQKSATQAAVMMVKQQANKENRHIVAQVLRYYDRTSQTARKAMNKTDAFEAQVNIYALQAIQIERDQLAQLLEDGKITTQVAAEVREKLGYDELLLAGNESAEE